jgi:hypothetical protein
VVLACFRTVEELVPELEFISDWRHLKKTLVVALPKDWVKALLGEPKSVVQLEQSIWHVVDSFGCFVFVIVVC